MAFAGAVIFWADAASATTTQSPEIKRKPENTPSVARDQRQLYVSIETECDEFGRVRPKPSKYRVASRARCVEPHARAAEETRFGATEPETFRRRLQSAANQASFRPARRRRQLECG
jgi:hypothetical protein